MASETRQRVRRGVAIGLRVKALAGAVLLVASTSTFIGVAVLRITESEARRSYATRLELVERQTAGNLSYLIQSPPDRDGITRQLLAALRTSGIVFCACFDHDGHLLGCAGLPVFDQPIEPTLSRLGPTSLLGQTIRTNDGELVELRATPVHATPHPSRWLELPSPSVDHWDVEGARRMEPIDASPPRNRDVGMLLVGHTWLPVRAEFGPTEQQIVTFVASIGAVAALLAWLAARRLVRPLHELVRGTERLARGDFDQEVVVHSRDELALLADSFNAMSVELKESRAELARQNQALEVAVRARTRKLREAYQELKVLDRMKDGFLSSISHEFRTPITSIRAFAEILLQDGGTDAPTRREFLEIILRESERLGELMSAVLELVQIEAGEIPFRFERIEPAQPVEAAVREMESAASERKVRVECQTAPAQSPALWDGAKITRLVHELLKNAVRFTPSGSTVHVQVAESDGLVRIDVRDEGPGIPSDMLESIFEKFRQGGDVLTGKPQGQGLGLPLCRLIASRHGGTVRALTVAERGAHFVVELPLAPPAIEPEDKAEQESLPDSVGVGV